MSAAHRPAVPTRELAPGYVVPRLIKGGWQLAGGHGTVDRTEAIADMVAFLTGEHAGFVTGSTLSLNGGQYMAG